MSYTCAHRNISLLTSPYQNGIFTMQNTCHMTTNMVQLSYDNERRRHDGGRASPIAQRAWLDSLQTQAARTGIFLRAEMETRSSLHRVRDRKSVV